MNERLRIGLEPLGRDFGAERSVRGRHALDAQRVELPCGGPGRWQRRRLQACRGSLLVLAAALLACGPPPPRVLLLVTVDTLRADELGAYGSTRGLTPNLDALARDSVVFERAYAAAPLTLPSISALLTGRHPEELGLRNNESTLPSSVPTLATELAGRGWQTGAVIGNFVLRRASGLARGFDVFDDDLPQREAVRRWPERIGPLTTQAALRMLQDCDVSRRARCFLWVHYQDPHGPYDPPAERRAALLPLELRAPDGHRELPVGGDSSGIGAIPAYQFLHGRRDLAYYRAGYRAEIRTVDEEVGRLLAGVDARGLRAHAVVVFAADHGESLGENDVWFAHGGRLDDAQVRVPLMLRQPGRAAARRNDPVSLADLYPTLLKLLEDVPVDGAAPGRDLLARDAAATPSRPYFSTLGATAVQRHGVVADGHKLIVVAGGAPHQERLHRLGNDAADVSASAPEVAARLRRELAARRLRLQGGVEAVPQALSEADRESLRALGYLEEDAADGASDARAAERPRGAERPPR
jgi:arylsulfatase